jgi:hypothetical protein
MAESRTYQLGGLTIERLGQHVEQFLRGERDLFVEAVNGPGGYLVQARLQGNEWRRFIGLDKAIQVQILPASGAAVTVSVGQGKWIDKLGLGAVGALWFPPLAIASGIGAVLQLKLISDIFDSIQRYLIVNSRAEGSN